MSEAEIIRRGIAAADANGCEIDDRTARVIAAQWHGGQTSALYALASSGAILYADLWYQELSVDYRTASADDRRALDYLGTYLLSAGVRGPVPGWSDLHY